MKPLTQAEEEVMQILWSLDGGFVKDIISRFSDPKPAYNTVSTIVRILEKKGFVDYESFGKSHRYRPLISKDEYSKKFMRGFVEKYFSGSYKQMVSFFTDQKDLTVKDLEILLEQLKADNDD